MLHRRCESGRPGSGWGSSEIDAAVLNSWTRKCRRSLPLDHVRHVAALAGVIWPSSCHYALFPDFLRSGWDGERQKMRRTRINDQRGFFGTYGWLRELLLVNKLSGDPLPRRGRVVTAHLCHRHDTPFFTLLQLIKIRTWDLLRPNWIAVAGMLLSG